MEQRILHHSEIEEQQGDHNSKQQLLESNAVEAKGQTKVDLNTLAYHVNNELQAIANSITDKEKIQFDEAMNNYDQTDHNLLLANNEKYMIYTMQDENGLWIFPRLHDENSTPNQNYDDYELDSSTPTQEGVPNESVENYYTSADAITTVDKPQETFPDDPAKLMQELKNATDFGAVIKYHDRIKTLLTGQYEEKSIKTEHKVLEIEFQAPITVNNKQYSKISIDFSKDPLETKFIASDTSHIYSHIPFAGFTPDAMTALISENNNYWNSANERTKEALGIIGVTETDSMTDANREKIKFFIKPDATLYNPLIGNIFDTNGNITEEGLKKLRKTKEEKEEKTKQEEQEKKEQEEKANERTKEALEIIGETGDTMKDDIIAKIYSLVNPNERDHTSRFPNNIFDTNGNITEEGLKKLKEAKKAKEEKEAQATTSAPAETAPTTPVAPPAPAETVATPLTPSAPAETAPTTPAAPAETTTLAIEPVDIGTDKYPIYSYLNNGSLLENDTNITIDIDNKHYTIKNNSGYNIEVIKYFKKDNTLRIEVDDRMFNNIILIDFTDFKGQVDGYDVVLNTTTNTIRIRKSAE